ncbi:CoA-transferase [Lacisediminihabitans sp. FW035]
MIEKVVDHTIDAVAGIEDDSTVMLSGFGWAGHPIALIDALLETKVSGLTIVSNNAGNGETGPSRTVAGWASEEGHLLFSSPKRFMGVRWPESRRKDQARAGSSGQSC